jgi:FkbM family methyltransferase
MASVFWSMLWEASAARRHKGPLLKRVEVRLRGKRFIMDIDLAESPECGYLLRNPTIHITAQLLGGGGTMLDVGANVGFHALTAALFYKHVVAFEPTPETAARLEHNVELSNFSNVRVERIALSNRDGDASFAVNPAHCGSNRLSDARDNGATSIRVSLRRLDSMLDSLGSVDLLKIDVEGHECEVIEGGRALLNRDRPTLIVEFNEAAQFDRFRSLLPQGYRAVRVALDGSTKSINDGALAVAVRDVTFTAR